MQSASTGTIKAGHLIALLVATLLPLNAWADIFVTFGSEASFCTGNSTEDRFSGASDVLAVDLEVQQNVLKPLTLAKLIDGCTTALLAAAFAGTEIDAVVIVATDPEEKGRVAYDIRLEDAQVTRVQQDGQEGQLVEGVTIESDAATIRFFRYSFKGNVAGIDEVSLVGE
jgi:type VI protein secretion system component Hcp